jgi:hypothetical protein
MRAELWRVEYILLTIRIFHNNNIYLIILFSGGKYIYANFLTYLMLCNVHLSTCCKNYSRSVAYVCDRCCAYSAHHTLLSRRRMNSAIIVLTMQWREKKNEHYNVCLSDTYIIIQHSLLKIAKSHSSNQGLISPVLSQKKGHFSKSELLINVFKKALLGSFLAVVKKYFSN